MEYLFGSLVTLAGFALMSRLFKKVSKKDVVLNFRYSQSYFHDLILPVLPLIEEGLREESFTQARKHYNKTNIKVLFSNDKAYWIKDNIFYNADVQDGIVLQETSSRVDIMGMDKVQLDKMSFIVDMLTEGTGNDNWSSGNKSL